MATAEDIRFLAEQEHYELIGGKIVPLPPGTPRHGFSLFNLGACLGNALHHPSDRRGPGGWWILLGVHIECAPDQILRPDLVGFRRERVPRLTDEFPMRTRPDWVCEVLSEGHERVDRFVKRSVYQRYEIPHYWIVDPVQETLTVLRWTPEGHVIVADALRGERLRAEPFEAVEIDVDAIFGDVAE